MTKFLATIPIFFVAITAHGQTRIDFSTVLWNEPNPTETQSEWRQFVDKCGRMGSPALVWLNYRNEYAEQNLAGFDHIHRKGNEFGGGVCVVIAEPRKADGEWWLYEVARIDADECSVKAIRDAWAKHKGHFRKENYEPTQGHQPSMMGGYGTMNYGGSMMYAAPPRRFMFRGAACAT